MNFTTSQKGAELAIHKGYIYRREGKLENGVSWLCNETHCKGRLNLLKDEIKVKNEDCYGPSRDRLNARRIKENVKERAKLCHDKSEAVKRELQIEFPVESAVELPLPGATSKMVNRIRATAHFHMPTRKILTDVADIPESLKITHGRKEFFYYDSGSHDPERLLIFATASNLGVLEDSERWYCDGTCSTPPDVFYQVYTKTYYRIFKALNLSPSSVTIDFETAVRNALKQISTGVQISFCYFFSVSP